MAVLIVAGGTPGMRALHLRVVRATDGGPVDAGTAAVRYLCTLISGLALGLGYLWIAFDPHKQAWHDKLATTYVIVEQ